MILKTLDGSSFGELVKNGSANLRANYEEVDKLNVFPVPDGDTGTNMCRTIESGVSAITEKPTENIGEMGKILARGMLFGARGNSGVILSQIFNGICKGFDGKESVNVKQLAEAYKLGIKQAYGAVVTPVEGTILTVFREAVEYACDKINEETTINQFFENHLTAAITTLKKTKEMLPVLKEANVIDSGGAGYVYIVKGIVKYLDGEKIENQLENESEKENKSVELDFDAFTSDSELEFGYCTEFILRLQNKKVDVEKFDVQTVIDYLQNSDVHGESIVALKNDSIVKVHVHTSNPGLVLTKMREFGEFLTLKIENMALQHNEINQEDEPVKEHTKYATVAVSSGDGISAQMEEFGVDYIIKGGQTMNPSTEDFIKAYKKVNADNIFVFPNNKNIIMAAKQSAEIYTDANVVVIESKSIPQCLTALVMLDYSSDDLTLIEGNFIEGVRSVVSGEITTAIRNTKVHGTIIHKGNYIGILDGKIVTSTVSPYQVIVNLIKKIPNYKDKYCITLIYGKDATEKDKAEARKFIERNFPYMEISAIDGGQEVYKFLLAIA